MATDVAEVGDGDPSSSSDRPQRTSEPAPGSRRLLESWEYPMSKEEKKDRVIFLFEQELIEARQNEEQTLDDLVNGPANSVLERLEELRPGTAKRLKEAIGVEAKGRSLWLWLGFAVLLAAVAYWVGGGPRPPRPSPESWESMEAPAENLSEELSENPVTAATMDMGKVQHLRRLAQQNLKRSDCAMAAHFFGQAQEVLRLAGAEAQRQDVAAANASLLVERGFALICSHRFEDGKAMLQGCVTGQLKCSAHQLNALGYAFWKLKEFGKAAALFKMALDAEPANAIIWNNLGAALVELRDWAKADEALLRAVQLTEEQPRNRETTVNHINELKHRLEAGEAKTALHVEIWFAEDMSTEL